MITSNYLVLDGARRLEAATRNKLTYVPVIICRTWELFAEQFQPLADNAYPLTWLEIADLINNVLRPLNQEFRYRMGNMTRDTRRVQGTMPHSDGTREYNYSYFTLALADMFKAQPVHIKMLRDNVRRMYKLKETDPELVTTLCKAIQDIEPANRVDLTLVRVLKTVLDRYQRGSENATAASDLLRDQVRAMGNQTGALKYTRRRKNTLDSTAPVVGLNVIRSFAEVLQNLTMQTEGFRNFKPVTRYQFEQFTAAYQTVIHANAKLYRLRRRMESALHDYNPGEEKEQLNGE